MRWITIKNRVWKHENRPFQIFHLLLKYMRQQFLTIFLLVPIDNRPELLYNIISYSNLGDAYVLTGSVEESSKQT